MEALRVVGTRSPLILREMWRTPGGGGFGDIALSQALTCSPSYRHKMAFSEVTACAARLRRLVQAYKAGREERARPYSL